jgi:K+-transporting ATPase KdpF subunit
MRGLRLCLREALSMENVIVGIIAIGLIAYLFVALIRPEKF